MYGGGIGGCLTGARFTMTATLLHQNSNYVPTGEIDVEEYGEWVDSQDPLTGEVVRVWEPYDDENRPDPAQPGEVLDIGTIKCLARGIVDGGIRVAGTTERFSDSYENIDFVKLWTPPGTFITKRDRVTNIRDPRGRIIWADEEFVDLSDPTKMVAKASMFNVNGVTPLLDAFNRHVENFVLLENVEVNTNA